MLQSHKSTKYVPWHLVKWKSVGPKLMKQPLAPPHCNIIVAHRTSNHRPAIEIGQWTTIWSSRDTRLCHFYSYITIEMRHISCWNVPYRTPLEIIFITIWEQSYREPQVFLSIRPRSSHLASISQKLPHSATLENWMVCNQLDVLSIALAFSTSWTLKSISFQFLSS